jgi:hypothetical protein
LRRTCQLHHQIGAEGRKAAALLGAQGLPAFQAQHGGIRAEHGAVGQAEAAGAVEYLPPPSVEGPDLQARAEECVAGARVASGGGHADQLAIGCQFEHRLRVGFAHEGELLRSEPQLSWQQQVRLALVWNGGNVGSGGGGSDRHLPGGGGSAI